METETLGLVENIFKIGGPGVGLGFMFGAGLVLKIFLSRVLKAFEENTKILTKLETMFNERLPHD